MVSKFQRITYAIVFASITAITSHAYTPPFETIYSIPDQTDPVEKLFQATNGDLYAYFYTGVGQTIHRLSRESETNAYELAQVYTLGNISGMMQASDGAIYLTSAQGVYKIQDNAASVFYTHPSHWGAVGRLVEGTDGYLYGTRSPFPASPNGSIFKLSPAGAFTSLHEFNAVTDGADPEGGLVRGNDGAFYGTTTGGGAGFGSVYKITSDGIFTPLHIFQETDGAHPIGGLMLHSNGNMYGTTFRSVWNSTIFQLTHSGTVTTVYSFPSGGGGAGLHCRLVEGANGWLYGVTREIEQSKLFRVNPSGTFTLLHIFEYQSNSDELLELIHGNDGSIFGTGITFRPGTVEEGLENVDVDQAILFNLVDSPALDQPIIRVPPENQTTASGETVVLYAEAIGQLPLFFQWQKNGTNIGNIVEPFSWKGEGGFLNLPDATALDSGDYRLIVSNAVGVVTSVVATVTVLEPAIITAHPNSGALFFGASTNLSVTATGDGPLSFQWHKNNEPLLSATNSSLSINNAQLTDSGNYTVLVTGPINFVMSDVAALQVQHALAITGQPASISVEQGAPASFSVVVDGVEPIAYQWYYNDVEIEGANGATYQIVSAGITNAGSYKVEVSNDLDTEISDIATLVINPDALAPVLKVLAPKAIVYETESLLISGTVQDAVGVASVQYELNGAELAPADVVFVASGNASNWTQTVNLAAGTNEITVIGTDIAGNTHTVGPIKFYYHVASPLTIQTNLNGSVITTNGVGTVVNAIGSSLFADNNNTNLFVGRTYTLKALQTGLPNYILTNWTATWDDQLTPVELQTNNLTCTFEMKSNMVLNANFIDNPFSRYGGIYSGLFNNTNSSVSFHNAGFITLKVTPKLTFSAKMLVDGNAVSVSGKLQIDGTGTATGKTRMKIADKPELTVTVALDFVGGTDTLRGTVSQGGDWTSHLLADRLVYSRTNVLEQAQAYTNTYTMLFPGFTNNNDGPVGTGHGVVTVTAPGKLKVLGYGGDYNKMKQSSYISKDGRLPFYSAMYPLKRTNNADRIITESQGMKMGWLKLQTNGLSNLRPVGEVHWIKTGDWTNTTYTAGFTNVTDVISSRWMHNSLQPANTLPSMPFVNLEFTDGELGSSFSNAWRVSDSATFQLIKFLSPDTYEYQNSVRASMTAKNGLFRGVFIHPSTSLQTRYIGAILQDQNYGEGAFMGPTLGGKVTLDALLSEPTP